MGYSQAACLAWLACAELPPEVLRALFDYEEDPTALFSRFQTREDEAWAKLIPEGARRLLRRKSQAQQMESWEKSIQAGGFGAIKSEDAAYPEKLRAIPDAPAILFYQGELAALDRKAVAMVGSRNATYKGLEATKKIAESLSRNGICVISGLAYGIDTAAHQGCLKGGSPTIAVVGCGLDQDYPAENAGLRRQIIERGGCVLSEYAPGEKPLGRHFPWRNRIISGLGDCLALMEARIRSGSMTTVQHALNQGKDIFVYPGEPGNPKCEGNHQLLREGAIYFTTGEDLLEDMRWTDGRIPVPSANGHHNAAASSASLSPTERTILTELERGEQSFDQLSEHTQLPAATLSATLSLLQIQGKVQAMPGKIFRKIDPE